MTLISRVTKYVMSETPLEKKRMFYSLVWWPGWPGEPSQVEGQRNMMHCWKMRKCTKLKFSTQTLTDPMAATKRTMRMFWAANAFWDLKATTDPVLRVFFLFNLKKERERSDTQSHATNKECICTISVMHRILPVVFLKITLSKIKITKMNWSSLKTLYDNYICFFGRSTHLWFNDSWHRLISFLSNELGHRHF